MWRHRRVFHVGSVRWVSKGVTERLLGCGLAVCVHTVCLRSRVSALHTRQMDPRLKHICNHSAPLYILKNQWYYLILSL